jgi:hypothetical protein
MLLRALMAIFLLAAPGRSAAAQEKKPPLPPGRDPGGIAVALLSTGVDYTHPGIAPRLARDGEGELIGWDFGSNDNRPFAKGASEEGRADGTALALLLLDGGVALRIVPIRIVPDNPLSYGQALAFAAKTPARVVAIPMWSDRQEAWEPFRQAAQHFSQLLIVAAAGNEARDLDRNPVYPAGLRLPNLLVVTAGGERGEVDAGASWGRDTVDAVVPAQSASAALASAIQATALLAAEQPQLTGADLKRRLIEVAARREGAAMPDKVKSSAVISPAAIQSVLGAKAKR